MSLKDLDYDFEPCPFCGNKSKDELTFGEYRVSIGLFNDPKRTVTFYYIACSCGAQGSHGIDHEEAICLWNKRIKTPKARRPE